MSDHLLNFIENPVSWTSSDESESVTIADFDRSTVRKAIVGTGVFYFYDDGWNSLLYLILESPIELSQSLAQITVNLNRLAQFPCTGTITSNSEGYLVAPTVKIEVEKGSTIALMLLSPRTVPHGISPSKPALLIPNEANVTLSVEEGVLQCTGIVSGSNFESARLILNRNPHLPVYRDGYNQELCRLTGPGEIKTAWRPVAGSFEKCMLVFYPEWIGAEELEHVARSLGAPDDDLSSVSTATVIGDGLLTDYKLRLVLDRRFHRSVSDETNLIVK